ncbi:MAG: hypothetical protein AB1758_16175 [Candidatus Eremiobacterota bacterium]
MSDAVDAELARLSEAGSIPLGQLKDRLTQLEAGEMPDREDVLAVIAALGHHREMLRGLMALRGTSGPI